MALALRAVDPAPAYLASSEWIDAEHPAVASLARELAEGASSPVAFARRAFERVRDEVAHSADHRRNPVTCRASDVLRHRTGYCYAKSHLLAALLRAGGLPAGLCYQRLSLDGDAGPFALHGLVAVQLPGVGWYRVDPRGNKPGVEAAFAPPVERLAFAVTLEGERDFAEVHAEPLPAVVRALTENATWDAVLARLPDVDEKEGWEARTPRAPPGSFPRSV